MCIDSKDYCTNWKNCSLKIMLAEEKVASALKDGIKSPAAKSRLIESCV